MKIKNDRPNGIKACRTTLFEKLARRGIPLIAGISCGVSLLFSPATTGQAQTMEMLYGPQVGTRNNFSGMVGGEFMAGSTNIAVTHLGFYDQDEDGLAASHHVGLFTGDGSTLLASVEVPVGTDALLTNGYRWVVLDVPL